MNKLLYLSGNDIPFVQASITIHQPKIKQIAFLGQDIFYLGCNLLCFSKENLEEKDKLNLTNKTNFDILMSIVNNKTDTQAKASVVAMEMILSLIFPQYSILKMPTLLVLQKEQDGKKQQHIINNDNYEQFKKIIKEMFCLNTLSGSDYNPANKLAEQIANKLRDRHKKLSKKSDGNKSIEILSRYISILTLGVGHTIPELMEYTVFQLFDQFHRFERKLSYDSWYQAKLAGKLAGAQDLQDVDSWLSEEEEIPQAMPKSGRIEY